MKSQGSEETLDELKEVLILLSIRVSTTLTCHTASLEAGEYSGLSGHRWTCREFVAGQAGPQGRRSDTLRNTVEILRRILSSREGGTYGGSKESPSVHAGTSEVEKVGL